MRTLLGGRPARLWVGLLAAILVASLVGVASPAPVAAAEGDLQLVSENRSSERRWDLTFTTPALANSTTVRVLLPTGFDPAAPTRYPVLYLLHGGAADYR